jgi:hypothetical protein
MVLTVADAACIILEHYYTFNRVGAQQVQKNLRENA